MTKLKNSQMELTLVGGCTLLLGSSYPEPCKIHGSGTCPRYRKASYCCPVGESKLTTGELRKLLSCDENCDDPDKPTKTN